MDTYIRDLKNTEVDDIDDEVYYREMFGCKADMEKSGTCATLSCGQDKFRVCQKPGLDIATESPCGDGGCADAC